MILEQVNQVKESVSLLPLFVFLVRFERLQQPQLLIRSEAFKNN